MARSSGNRPLNWNVSDPAGRPRAAGLFTFRCSSARRSALWADLHRGRRRRGPDRRKRRVRGRLEPDGVTAEGVSNEHLRGPFCPVWSARSPGRPARSFGLFDELALEDDVDLVADHGPSVQHRVEGHAEGLAVDVRLAAVTEYRGFVRLLGTGRSNVVSPAGSGDPADAGSNFAPPDVGAPSGKRPYVRLPQSLPTVEARHASAAVGVCGIGTSRAHVPDRDWSLRAGDVGGRAATTSARAAAGAGDHRVERSCTVAGRLDRLGTPMVVALRALEAPAPVTRSKGRSAMFGNGEKSQVRAGTGPVELSCAA